MKSTHWRLEIDADGVAWLALDKGGASTNSLSREVMEELDAMVAEEATTEENEAFRTWLIATAQAAADAAKEGGFMGFGAVQISEGEQTMLDQLRGALGER